MTERLQPGDTAPAFTLPDADGTEVSLADHKGRKVIVYFYPAALTPGCTKQACDFTDNLELLAGAGYDVIGVSPDKPEKLAKFREKENLRVTLLADPTSRSWRPTAPSARRSCTARRSSASSAPRSSSTRTARSNAPCTTSRRPATSPRSSRIWGSDRPSGRVRCGTRRRPEPPSRRAALRASARIAVGPRGRPPGSP